MWPRDQATQCNKHTLHCFDSTAQLAPAHLLAKFSATSAAMAGLEVMATLASTAAATEAARLSVLLPSPCLDGRSAAVDTLLRQPCNTWCRLAIAAFCTDSNTKQVLSMPIISYLCAGGLDGSLVCAVKCHLPELGLPRY